MRLAAATALAFVAMPALAQLSEPPGADLTVRFEEGLGADIFYVENTSTCLATVLAVTIDLGPSAGGMVFDTEYGGGGYNGAYPFALREGAEAVTAATGGGDGETTLRLELSGLRPHERVVFSIDTDDALAQSPWGQTRIAGPELAGAMVSVQLRRPDGREEVHEAPFREDARAYVNPRNCAVS